MNSPRRNDCDLTIRHVQALSSADQLADFFAYLHYPTDARISMTPKSLQLNTALTNATRRIERLTTVNGMLQVYLFELTSVTVAHTQALARAFRDRVGNFLLVLTDDYRQLDFVLLEREIPGLDVSTRSVLVRPRVLSVDRRDPDPVALRVLRRFTFTEYDADGDPDPYAQFDKLRSAYTVAEWSEPLFNNRALFSDYYLNERLPDLPEWDDEDRNRAFRAMRGAFAQARRRFSGEGAATARNELIRPLLEILGFRLALPSAPTGGDQDGEPVPDFLLSTDGEDEPTAFVLAYPWNRYLDGKDAQDPERPEENPGAQVVSLLEGGAAPWGIVTNGKLWRLYSARAHSRATNYYEIDLEETLASPDPGQAFRYFYLFFRAAAFAPETRAVAGEARELTFLDWLMDESAAYARELGERLKDRVFEQIFPHFAEGFVAGMGGPQALLDLPEAERETQLDAIFQGTLNLLYRLLFLLYAESRDLLPVREVRGYYRVSLQRLKEQVAQEAGPLEDQVAARLAAAYGAGESQQSRSLGFDTPDAAHQATQPAAADEVRRSSSARRARIETKHPHNTALYDRLLDLFAVIDRGSAARNVPIYNGGLFITEPRPDDTSPEAQAARFLNRTRLPDRYLALGLDRLARDVDPKRGDLGFIDFKSLGVRQLGSIYEGLLEFKVRVAPAKMAVVEGKKTEEVLPYAEAKRQKRKILTEGRGRNARERTLPRGTVYLENDRRERKATGSYYTPDYIVKYIVRHTVGPVLDEKLAALRPRLAEVEGRYRAVVKKKRETERVIPDEPALLQNVAGDLLRDLFDVKVLDPAMGSGHFLVEAVDYVTDRLVRFLDGYPFLATFFQGMRASILDEMERQGVSVDPARLTDVTLLKRHVLKRCIYGVDLNPMAVELAKVSLWLDCFTLGAPLSFLDHHLRRGNSLIGAMAREVEAQATGPTPAGQTTFLTGPFVGLLQAADVMQVLSGIADVTLEQVRESRSLFDDFEEKAKPYKRLLDVHVAQHFGVARAAEFLEVHEPERALEMVMADPETLDGAYGQTLRQARDLYQEKRFFHWDLEFPEVFIDLARAAWKEEGGFDAVVGNPPYYSISTLPSQDIVYLKRAYPDVFTGNSDILYYFLRRSDTLPRRGCSLGMIVGRYFQEAKYAAKLRNFLNTSTNLVQLVDFGNFQVFGSEVNVLASIVILQRSPSPTDDRQVQVVRLKAEDAEHGRVADSLLQEKEAFEVFATPSPSADETWNFFNPRVALVSSKLTTCSTSLGEIANVVQSMQTGRNEILAPDRSTLIEHSIKDELIHPIAKAGSIERYEFEELDSSIIWTEGVAVDDYPNLKTYLLPYKEDLASRYDIKNRAANWWEISNPRNASLFFSDRPRILVPFIATGNKFCVDTKKRLNDGGDIRAIFFDLDSIYSEYYVCAILNSKLCEYYHLRHTKLKRGGYYEYFEGQLSSLPIRRIHFSTPQAERERRVASLVARHERGEQKALLAEVEALLPQSAAGEFLAFQPQATGAEEKSDVVHDLLAYLAEQMIEMHKEKQARVERFWSNLKAACDSPAAFDTLRNKGKWEQSLAKDPACRPFVDAGSRSTRHLDESLGWDEACFAAFAGMLAGKSAVTPRLLDVYRQHHPQYKALVERIKSTDNLIDQIVYRLYGLTEDEIAVVGGG